MNRNLRSATLASLFTLAAVATIGCNPAALSYFLFKGDGKAPADFPLKPPEGRKEIRVAIMVAAPNAPVDFAGVDRDLARLLGQILTEQTKEKRNPIQVIDQSKIDRFKLTTPGWKSMSPVDVARQLGADYLIDAKVMNLGLYEAGTGRLMYQGQGTVEAEVYDSAAAKEHSRYFVNAKLEAKPADTVQPGQYRAMLLQRIADELSWKHLPHITDRRVAPVQ